MDEHDKSHQCSKPDCTNPAVVYHHATQGKSKIWRNRYRCADCLEPGMEVRGGRVWRDNSIGLPTHVESTVVA